VRWYYGRAPAVLAAVVLITNPYFMASAGWQYPDGAAMAYAMAGLALYLRPTGNRRWNSFWAAAMLVLSGATNLAAGPLILAILAVPLWCCRHRLMELLKETACSAAGAGVAAYALARLSQRVFGDAHFLRPQIDQTLHVMQTPASLAAMWGSGPGFLPGALRLFTPAFLLVFGFVLLAAIRKPAAPAWPLYLALLVCCALYSLEEFGLHGVALRVFYHSSYMQVVVLGFAGVALGEIWRRTPGSGRRRAVCMAVLAAAGIALCLAFSAGLSVVPNGHDWSTLAVMGAVSTMLAMLARWPNLPVQHLTCALLMAAVFLGPALDLWALGFTWASPKLAHGSNLTSTANAVAFSRLMDLESYVKSHVEVPRSLLFWWDDDEPHSLLFTSGAALFVCAHENVNQALATGDVGRLDGLFGYSKTIVHLTTHPERMAQRGQMMAARGVVVGNERRTTIECAGRPFTVVLQDVIGDPRVRR
jgi:hypothetical protein